MHLSFKTQYIEYIRIGLGLTLWYQHREPVDAPTDGVTVTDGSSSAEPHVVGAPRAPFIRAPAVWRAAIVSGLGLQFARVLARASGAQP